MIVCACLPACVRLPAHVRLSLCVRVRACAACTFLVMRRGTMGGHTSTWGGGLTAGRRRARTHPEQLQAEPRDLALDRLLQRHLDECVGVEEGALEVLDLQPGGTCMVRTAVWRGHGGAGWGQERREVALWSPCARNTNHDMA